VGLDEVILDCVRLDMTKPVYIHKHNICNEKHFTGAYVFRTHYQKMWNMAMHTNRGEVRSMRYIMDITLRH
jgi:hypothetical protein